MSLEEENKHLMKTLLPFEGGQVTRIDTKNMVATFVAMREWGPDGKTLYWIATDATPLTDDITRGGNSIRTSK